MISPPRRRIFYTIHSCAFIHLFIPLDSRGEARNCDLCVMYTRSTRPDIGCVPRSTLLVCKCGGVYGRSDIGCVPRSTLLICKCGGVYGRSDIGVVAEMPETTDTAGSTRVNCQWGEWSDVFDPFSPPPRWREPCTAPLSRDPPRFLRTAPPPRESTPRGSVQSKMCTPRTCVLVR